MPSNGGERIQLFNNKHTYFKVAKNGIYLLTAVKEESVAIKYHDFVTGKEKIVIEDAYYSFCISPDERYILYTGTKDYFTDIDIIEHMWE